MMRRSSSRGSTEVEVLLTGLEVLEREEGTTDLGLPGDNG